MDKLVRGNLVRGLPLKLFENNHTCVACQKGKQHKASCKTKLVSSISQPLQMLHMDLFSPTFVKSLDKKMYCLVVTDDFSRSPNLDFMRPFGCFATILNTLDHLGKFEGKVDEGFLVGYSVNSKAFRKNDAQYPAKDGDKNDHKKDVRYQEEDLRKQIDQETERLVGQGEATITNSTNRLNTASPSISVVG
ncbi:hypothetical protein Tco_1535596, partial [Tanacetum coccineum]